MDVIFITHPPKINSPYSVHLSGIFCVPAIRVFRDRTQPSSNTEHCLVLVFKNMNPFQRAKRPVNVLCARYL